MDRPSRDASHVGVCYLISEYPKISHTFIEREVEAVRRSGVRVETVAIRPSPTAQVISEAGRRASKTTNTILPLSPGAALRGIVVPALGRPRAFLAAARAAQAMSPPGVRSRLWHLFYLFEALLVWRRCADLGIRHIHAHFANVSSNLAWIATVFGNNADDDGEAWTWSFTMHGSIEFYDVRQYALPEKVRAASFVACVSDYTRAQVLRLVDESQWHKVTVVRAGIDPAHLGPRGRAQSERPSGVLELLFIGRITPEKGLAVLLEALRLLKDRGVPCRLTLVGEGPRTTYVRQAERLGVADRTSFPGAVSQDDISGLYHRSDVFVMSSFAEGLPVVLMEALACEVAVVAPWISGIPELIEHEVTGLLVPPARADLLADAIERLARDEDLRTRLAAAGRQRVLDLHDSRSGGEHMAALFRSTRAAAHRARGESSDASTSAPERPPGLWSGEGRASAGGEAATDPSPRAATIAQQAGA